MMLEGSVAWVHSSTMTILKRLVCSLSSSPAPAHVAQITCATYISSHGSSCCISGINGNICSDQRLAKSISLSYQCQGITCIKLQQQYVGKACWGRRGSGDAWWTSILQEWLRPLDVPIVLSSIMLTFKGKHCISQHPYMQS